MRFFIVFYLILSSWSSALAGDFQDIPRSSDWYISTAYASEIGIFSGYEDGSFKPNRILNRAEALKIITRAAKIPADIHPANPFEDVRRDQWFYSYVTAAFHRGIISKNTEFSPGRSVNKAEFLKMLIKAFQIDPEQYELQAKTDDLDIDAWYAPYFQFALQYEIITVDTENLIYPAEYISRGDAADIIFFLLKSGEGLDAQTLLLLAEKEIIFLLESEIKTLSPEIAQAFEKAHFFVNTAGENLPENKVIRAAKKTIQSLESIVQAKKISTTIPPDPEEMQKALENAEFLATQAVEINPHQSEILTQIKGIATTIREGLVPISDEIPEEDEDETDSSAETTNK